MFSEESNVIFHLSFQGNVPLFSYFNQNFLIQKKIKFLFLLLLVRFGLALSAFQVSSISSISRWSKIRERQQTMLSTVVNGAQKSIVNDWATQIKDILKDINPPGSFAMTHRMDPPPFPLPIITVEGVGQLGLPLMACALESLKAVAAKSPIGRGEATIYDEKVRKAWEIEPAKVTFGKVSNWDDYLKTVVAKACFELGLSYEHQERIQLHANLYKVLFYETGGHFTPYGDAEKEDGMFAMIIQLPISFTGGDIVWHQDEPKTMSLADNSSENYHCTAFYADCLHQIHPVTSGVRLCLVYNLVESPDVESPSYDLCMKGESDLRSIAKDWMADEHAPPKLGYKLSHQYTRSSFGISTLKGRDDVVFKQLDQGKTKVGKPLFQISLLLMKWLVVNKSGDIAFGEDTEYMQYMNIGQDDDPYEDYYHNQYNGGEETYASFVIDGRLGESQSNPEGWIMVLRDDR
jgi:hypothetical protein